MIVTCCRFGQNDIKASGGSTVIEFDNVAYSYGGAELFSGLNLTLAPGSFHFLTGPSGAGKTTLLKLCYGELLATSGEVRLFDQPAQTMGRSDVAVLRRRIGVVHQDCQFLDHLPLVENIALPRSCRGASGKGLRLRGP